ncbi:MAG: hypothetical protein J6S63_09140 [Atopobiaceae bacterium]|nr:hypothetical protein [Atopobiaceae bacterium]
MTSYTLDNGAPDLRRSALVYVVTSLACALFGAVYELFSHEVYSYFMIYAFALPLGLGALPNLALACAHKHAPGRFAANAWNSGVATLTVGSIFRGATDIYGTTCSLAVAYPVVGAALLVVGLVAYALSSPRLSKKPCPPGVATPDVVASWDRVYAAGRAAALPEEVG